jgi:hypothetical protein
MKERSLVGTTIVATLVASITLVVASITLGCLAIVLKVVLDFWGSLG